MSIIRSKLYYQYEVFENGTIFNSNTGHQIAIREHNGRYELRLTINGKRKNVIFSRLLYWLFVDQFDFENKNLCVSFKDNNKLNISLDNLFLTERKNLIQGEGHRSIVKLSDEQIQDIRNIYKGNKINSNQFNKTGISLKDLAVKYGVTKKEIHFIVRGECRNTKNYKLK